MPDVPRRLPPSPDERLNIMLTRGIGGLLAGTTRFASLVDRRRTRRPVVLPATAAGYSRISLFQSYTVPAGSLQGLVWTEDSYEVGPHPDYELILPGPGLQGNHPGLYVISGNLHVPELVTDGYVRGELYIGSPFGDAMIWPPWAYPQPLGMGVLVNGTTAADAFFEYTLHFGAVWDVSATVFSEAASDYAIAARLSILRLH